MVLKNIRNIEIFLMEQFEGWSEVPHIGKWKYTIYLAFDEICLHTLYSDNRIWFKLETIIAKFFSIFDFKWIFWENILYKIFE